MMWNTLFVVISSAWLVNSMDIYYHPPRGSSVWGYFTPPLLKKEPPYQTPMEAMVDLTNSLGIAILQDHTFSRGNFAFSPYGVASVLVVLYEGARGESARQIHRAIGFPSERDRIRIGFRDIHRHLRSYFSHEGYLSGISLNKETSSLKPGYKKILRFYGYDVELSSSSDDDDDMTPVSAPPGNEAAKMTTATTTARSTKDSGIGTSPKDKNYTNPPNLGNEKAKATTIACIVLPTENITEADQNSTEPSAYDPSDLKKPNQGTTERDAEQTTQTTVFPTTTNVPTTITDQPSTKEMIQNGGDDRLELLNTTEAVKATALAAATTPLLNVTTTLDDEKTTVTMEPVTTQSMDGELRTPTVISHCKEEDCLPTTVRTTTRIFEESTTPPRTPSGLQEMLSLTNALKVHTGTETAAAGRSSGAREVETRKGVKTEEITYSNLDSSTLVPQSDNLLNPKPTEKRTESRIGNFEGITDTKVTVEPRTMSTIAFGAESKSGKTEGTADAEVSTELGSMIKTASGMRSVSENFGGTADTKVTAEPKTMSTAAFGTESTGDKKQGITDARGSNTSSQTGSQFKARNLIKMSGKILNSEEKANIRNIINTRVPLWLERKSKKPKSRKIRTITDYLKSPHSPDMSLQLQNGMYDTHVSRNADLYRSLPRLLFLVDGAIDTPVPMMTYTNVFTYAYIPKLHAKALEFPLDDIRYKLLILLPVERRGLRQLIYDLLDYSLSDVLLVMKPVRVKAMVPTFMVEGFVILTSSLQKLGIWDVFDPRKANLSGMSMDPELYVRNVEQSVTVVIRNYVEILDIQTRTMAARYMEHEFEATHPFLYFVLDTSTNVALMAGQILDPLNSRIY